MQAVIDPVINTVIKFVCVVLRRRFKLRIGAFYCSEIQGCVLEVASAYEATTIIDVKLVRYTRQPGHSHSRTSFCFPNQDLPVTVNHHVPIYLSIKCPEPGYDDHILVRDDLARTHKVKIQVSNRPAIELKTLNPDGEIGNQELPRLYSLETQWKQIERTRRRSDLMVASLLALDEAVELDRQVLIQQRRKKDN